jgi:hypothetical protein
MRQVVKTEDGIFIPKELIADFEHVEIDASEPTMIVIRSPRPRRPGDLDEVVARIKKQREEIFRERGLLSDSAELIREDRDSR